MSILIPKGANDAINSREEFFKEKEDHTKKQKREKFIAERLETAGMRYNYAKMRFEYQKGDVFGYFTFEDFEGANEEQITKLAEAYKKYIQET